MATYRTLDADKMLDIYIYDYLLKRKHNDSAQIFLREAGVPPSPAAIDAPGGFLFEWWSVFWDVFISRYKQMGPTKEAVHEAEDHRNLLNQQQLQQLRHNMVRFQQPSVSNSSTSLSERSNMLNALAKRKLEESRNWPLVRKDAFTVEGKKPRYYNEMVPVQDLSPDSHVGQMMHDPRVRSTGMMDHNNQQLVMFPGYVGLMPMRDTVSDGSVYGAHVTGTSVNDSPLEGWPLKGQGQSGGGSQNYFQPQFVKRGQVVQHSPQSNYPSSEFVQLPIYLPQLGGGGGGGASGSGARDYGMLCGGGGGASGSGARDYGMPCTSVDSSSQTRIRQVPCADITPPITQTTTEDMALTLLASPDSSSNANTAIVGPPQSLEQNQADKFVSEEPGVDEAECFTYSNIIGGGEKINSESEYMTLTEIGTILSGNVNLCEFSFHGKFVASCAGDEKVVLWCTESKNQTCVMDEHDLKITDIRFGPRSTRLATSSHDRTVKIWNVNNPSKSLKTLKGHTAPVLSLDFHPEKDLVCSSDSVNGIRYWDAQTGGCIGNSRGGASKVRFQPCHGKYLAAAVENGVSVIDVETAQSCRHPLQGHTRDVLSICWNASGEHLVSLSEDLIKVWKFGRGEGKNCVGELRLSGNTFSCCVFHPVIPSLLIIGFNQSLELWDIAENKLVSVLRQQPVNTLAVSEQAGLVASAIDGCGGVIKLWK